MILGNRMILTRIFTQKLKNLITSYNKLCEWYIIFWGKVPQKFGISLYKEV